MTHRTRHSATPPSFAPTNAEQAKAWDGDEGAYWAAHHDLFEESLARYQPAFLDAAAVQAGERVLDIGCGTGVSTRAAAVLAGDGEVLGVDLSSEMLAVARRLAAQEALANVSFLQADAQVHPFEPAGVDLVISRTGSMFFGDPPAAFANLRRSLRPDGRLVLLTWRGVELQEWLIAFATALAGRVPPPPDPEAPGPFSLSDPPRVRAVLEGAGFSDIELTAVDETTTYGRSVEEAHALLVGLLGWMVEDRGPARDASLEALRTTLAAHSGPDGIRFGSAAWLITARAA